MSWLWRERMGELLDKRCDFELLEAMTTPTEEMIKVQSKAGQFMIDLKATIHGKTRVEVFSYARNLENMLANVKPEEDSTEARARQGTRMRTVHHVINNKVKRLRPLPKGDSRSFVVVIDTGHIAKVITTTQQMSPRRPEVLCDI